MEADQSMDRVSVMRRIGSVLALTLMLAVIPTDAGAAGGRFTDDDFSVHEADIEALAHAGITQGCSPTRFCPDESVTRGQMAAFLRRSPLGDIPSTHPGFSDTVGHPFADVGYLCMQMRMPSNVEGVRGLRDRNLDELGIPSEREYVAEYCRRVGIDGIDNFGFYVAFSFFRLAAIIQGVARRAVDGNASNRNAAELGKLVGPMAGLALEAIQEAS